jgi:hypothetical protein
MPPKSPLRQAQGIANSGGLSIYSPSIRWGGGKSTVARELLLNVRLRKATHMLIDKIMSFN